ncbi:MAG: lamin tail domain-containing protein [Anaerolineales bacterium]|nr:lamin tail domain-containing protein [Anaerolineales bacterium]
MHSIHPRRRWPAIAIACVLNLALLFSLLPANLGGANVALAASSTVVISQVYGGGGNTGATYKNDYIELFNRGSAPVSLAGWSVQYASSTGTSWQKTDLTGVTLQPGQYYLVQQAQGAGGTVPLPPPDAIGTTTMSSASGKVVLANTNTVFTAGTACPSGANVIDIVGFGGANCFEGAPTPTLNNTTGAIRLANGCTDTDNNSLDFVVGAPTPRNSASPLAPCNVAAPTNPTGIGAATPAAIYGGEATLLTVVVTPGTNPNSTGITVAADLTTIGGAIQPFFDDGSNGDAVANDLTYSYLITPPANVASGAKTLSATVTDAQGRSSVTAIALIIRPPVVAIHAIQGAAHLSPYANTPVTIRGIVTALRTAGSTRGFYVQEVTPDADDATSEGIFVFTGSSSTPAAQVAVGDLVEVSGAVIEFRSGGSSSTNLTVTELTGPLAITRVSSGTALPAPIILGAGGRVPPNVVIEDDAAGSVETSGVFDPANDGIDFYESLEGMYVQVNDAVATGATRNFTTNREISVVGDNGANAGVLTPRGGIVLTPGDFNPERIILNDWIANGPTLPTVSVGAKFPGATLGVMDYSFGNFKLEVSQLPGNQPSTLVREVAAPATAHQLAIATYNVENLDPGDGPAKFDALANQIVNNLQSPDLIAIEELQDNTGPTNDGVVAADRRWRCWWLRSRMRAAPSIRHA